MARDFRQALLARRCPNRRQSPRIPALGAAWCREQATLAHLQRASGGADVLPQMVLARLTKVLLQWLETGRFPREEFRIHPALLILFAAIVLLMAAAVLERALG
jgi:hypothetical protein